MGADLLYYIMDYKGNYYRTNRTDQLEPVAEERDATIFTFAQANRRVGSGKKGAFFCMIPVEEEAESEDIFEIDSIAEEDNAVSDAEKETVTDIQEQISAEADDTLSPVKELTYDELTEEIAKNVSSYDLSEMDWTEYLTHFTYLVEGLKEYRDGLSKKHSDIEQKICDILHYIELCETNEEEAIDLVELLRVCRENRRDIKDELQRIEYFQTNFGTNANLAKAKQALKSIKGMETRKYKPRKYNALFENCVMKTKRLQRDDISQEDRRKERCRIGQAEKKEGESMTEERRYTPYDGKVNDWLFFARQQAEFYRNVGQYISNLHFDIQEIDAEIEKILYETENANCNVAQGYKVFKRLKELRLERKAKAKELDCLYAMTDYVDCKALADTCEENLKEVETILEAETIVEVLKKDTANIQKIERQEEMQLSEDSISAERTMQDMVS